MKESGLHLTEEARRLNRDVRIIGRRLLAGYGQRIAVLVLSLLCATAIAQQSPATPSSTLDSRPSTNLVLQLDGNGSYVELPPNIFSNLDGATVEGWVKWERYGAHPRFFDFGRMREGMEVNSSGELGRLEFVIRLKRDDPQNATPNTKLLRVDDVLQLRRWHHLAAVSGKGGMKLYLNGILVAQDPYEGSFKSIPNNDRNLLGRSNWQLGDTDFAGQMDEVRVWDRPRTEEQIRETMFKRLAGTEADLVGLWNFDDGTAKDSSPGHHDGTLVDGARVVAERRPVLAEILVPTTLVGQVTDPEGRPAPGAEITVFMPSKRMVRNNANTSGYYLLVLTATENSIEISAALSNAVAWHRVSGLKPGLNRQDFKLVVPASIQGKISSATGQPLSAAMVQLLAAEGGEPGSPIGSVSCGGTAPETPARSLTNNAALAIALSHEDGTYQFGRVWPGRYRLRVQVPGGFVDWDGGKEFSLGVGNSLTTVIQVPFHQRDPGSLATPAASNRVLRLRGKGSCVELPSNIFNELNAATLETWVGLDSPDRASDMRRIFNYGCARRDISLYLFTQDTSERLCSSDTGGRIGPEPSVAAAGSDRGGGHPARNRLGSESERTQ